MFSLEKLVRKNILNLKPYSSARSEFKGKGNIFLDANENPFGSPGEHPYNRYPDPLQLRLKEEIARLKGLNAENIFIGNGSDEPIDLLMRIFCEPGVDNIIINPPTYGMYEVVADVNEIEVRKSILSDDFQIDIERLRSLISSKTKIIFVCSPNNPTANAMRSADIETLLKSFDGILVVDEAYIDFSEQPSLLSVLDKNSNLVILQTFSKAWGLAGLRVGMAFASAEIIDLLNKIKFPYNVNEYSQQTVLKALDNSYLIKDFIKEIRSERELLIKELKSFQFISKIFPTDANFILFRTTDSKKLYNHLLEKNIVVRDRSSSEKCANCLRVTVGTQEENKALIIALKAFKI